ncbi:MAG: phage holin family protein [Balneolaceae bacterium]
MIKMDLIGQHIKNITKDLKDFLENRIELLILNSSEKIAKYIGLAAQQLFVLVIILVGLLFSLIGLGFYLGELFQSNAIGFLIIGGFILSVGLLLVAFKPNGISRKIQNQILNDIMQELDAADKNAQQKNHLPQIETKRDIDDAK